MLSSVNHSQDKIIEAVPACGLHMHKTDFAKTRHGVIFTFLKQAFNESLNFATVHSLMNDTNLIDSCQAHLPVLYASNIEFLRQK